MALNCCKRCRAWWTCVTKWYRGEKGEEDICCDVCSYYRECLRKEMESVYIRDDRSNKEDKDG